MENHNDTKLDVKKEDNLYMAWTFLYLKGIHA